MISTFSQNYKEEKVEIDFEMLVGGVKINYYIHCKTQLWLFSHFLTKEHESELVILGKMLEKISFKSLKLKQVLIDTKISLDIIRKGKEIILIDIKKSSKFQEAHVYQMLYYLWYLKNVKGLKNTKGKISYPKEKKSVTLILTEEKEREIKEIIEEVNKIIFLPEPPIPTYKKYCRKCAYFEFCFA